MKHRVAITGLGMVSPLGHTIEDNYNRLSARERGIARFGFNGHEALPHCTCGAITEFHPSSLIDNKRLFKLMNRESQLAWIAASRAITDSRIDDRYVKNRMGVYLGTGLTSGELDALAPIAEHSVDEEGEFSYRLLGTQALAKCNPLLSFKILPNMALSYIAIEHQAQGPNMVFTPWPGNALQAIVEAARSIQSGEIDCALAGGCDSKTNYVSFLTLERLGLLSRTGRGATPLSPLADGLIPGEGAACLFLESFEHAAQRNARIYSEILGGASASDCHSEKQFPSYAPVLEAAMRSACADAGVECSQIDCICTSMNSHPQGDATELHAIRSVFEDDRMPALAALSEYTGDLMAAAPAYQTAMCAYAFTQKSHFPFLSVPRGADAHERSDDTHNGMRTALINAFSIGTTKASLVIGHFDGE
ncbi:MAG TPA: beta-ketoacyl synthase N-terminal-like domain-containing protein [Bacteroidota bacterium]|nr:beta-ketoacyl synthase N-terminal-like domain-containing protein [Bacteroidota bacterium]